LDGRPDEEVVRCDTSKHSVFIIYGKCFNCTSTERKILVHRNGYYIMYVNTKFVCLNY